MDFYKKKLIHFGQVVFLLFSLFNTVNGQKVSYFEGYEVKEFQLPKEGVWDLIDGIFRDKEGFIWLTAGFNLVRFDGYEYKLFSPKDKNLIPFYLCKDNIFEDSKKNIWIHSEEGLFKFNPMFEEFEEIKLPSENIVSGFHQVVTKIAEDDCGFIWIGTTTGLFRLPTNADLNEETIGKSVIRLRSPNYSNKLYGILDEFVEAEKDNYKNSG